jgi:hypothetical protein
MFIHCNGDINFKINDQPLVTLGFLNKNCSIDCIIVTNNASNDLNIDKVYKTIVIHTKKCPWT